MLCNFKINNFDVIKKNKAENPLKDFAIASDFIYSI